MQELNQITEDSIVNNPIEKKERVWGMLCHLTALFGLSGIPSVNVNIICLLRTLSTSVVSH